MSILLKSLALCVGLFAPLLASHATYMCWIEKVVKDGSGLKVYFQNGRFVSVSHPDGTGQAFIIEPSASEERKAEAKRLSGALVVDAVPVSSGDRLSSMNSGHDTCGMQVVEQSGILGVHASAFFAMPGGANPQSVEKFIPGE